MPKRRLIPKLLTALGLVAAIAAFPQARDVGGTIRDQITQAPLPGVSVVILETGDSTVTDGAGNYFFPGVTDGIYTFMVGGDHYQPNIKINVAVGTCCQQRGNVDHSSLNDVNVADVTYLVTYLFLGGPAPQCEAEADLDASGAVNISDLTYMVAYLFAGGPAPAPCG